MINENQNSAEKIILPYCFKDENMKSEVKLVGKGCNFPYLTYTYLQSISYSDKETRNEYRKVYIKSDEYKTLGIRAMSRAIKSGTETVSKNLNYLKKHNFLSNKTYKDNEGEFIKLYDIDKLMYECVELNFNNKNLNQILTKLRNKSIQLLIYYKFNSITESFDYKKYDEIAKTIGISKDVLSSHNKLLTELGLLEIIKYKRTNNRYGNIYKCLV